MPKFIMQSNGNPVFCFSCRKRNSESLPLQYPPIMIPTRPVGKGGEDDHYRWSWDNLPHCISCARGILKAMKDTDLEPTET